MNHVELLCHNGVTLYKDTVVGSLDDSDKLITVGSLVREWKEARDKEAARFEELADALRVLLDECKEERKNNHFQLELVRAIEHAEILLAVPKGHIPVEQQPYYIGHTAGQKWRDDSVGREIPANPYDFGSVQAQEWKTGFHDGYTSPPEMHVTV